MNKTTFTTGDDKKTLIVKRSFDASVDKVWQAFSIQDLLEQWWAPAPWKAVTKEFDFREGGHWLYAMTGPNGEQHWGMMKYETIEVETMLRGSDVFCDENGIPNDDLPAANWEYTFKQLGDKTTVTMTTVYVSPKDLQTVMDMGMEAGLSQALDQLEDLLGS